MSGEQMTDLERAAKFLDCGSFRGEFSLAAAFAEVRAEERERCAQIADAAKDGPPYAAGAMRRLIAQRIRE